MRALFLFLAILGVSVGHAITFTCFRDIVNGVEQEEPDEIVYDTIVTAEFGSETAVLGMTFDGYGRDDEVTVFEESEESEPPAGRDFATNANWDRPIHASSDFALMASW